MKKSKKNKKTTNCKKQKVFSKKKGGQDIVKKERNKSICNQINEKYRAINPMRRIACNNLKHPNGEKICTIELSRKDPHFDTVIHHFKMPTCVDIKQPKTNKSMEELYKKGKITRTTDIGEIEINNDNYGFFKSPSGTWKYKNKGTTNPKSNKPVEIEKTTATNYETSSVL